MLRIGILCGPEAEVVAEAAAEAEVVADRGVREAPGCCCCCCCCDEYVYGL